MALLALVLGDRNQRGEEVDYGFEISRAAAGTIPFVVNRIEAMAALGIKDDDVFLSPARRRVGDPVGRFLGLGGEYQGAGMRHAQQAVSELLAAGGAFAGAGSAGNQ